MGGDEARGRCATLGPEADRCGEDGWGDGMNALAEVCERSGRGRRPVCGCMVPTSELQNGREGTECLGQGWGKGELTRRGEIKAFQGREQKNLTKCTIHLLPSERCSSGRYIVFTTKLLRS